jgi:hypothetical protein
MPSTLPRGLLVLAILLVPAAAWAGPPAAPSGAMAANAVLPGMRRDS